MKNSIKAEVVENLILAFLVFLSVGLSARIWLGTQVRVSGSDSAVYHALSPVGEAYYLSTAVTPGRIVVHLGEDRHTVFLPGFSGYERVWSAVTSSLREIDAAFLEKPSPPSVEKSTVEMLRRTPGIELIISPPIHFGTWLEVLSMIPGASASEPGGPGGGRVTVRHYQVDRVAVFWDGSMRGFVRRADTGDYFELAFKGQTGKPREIVELSSSVVPGYRELTNEKGVPVQEGIFVPKRPPYIARVEVNPEPVDPERTAAQFFPDLTVIRRVEERDGCTVFTDGKGWLRVLGNGFLEFTRTDRARNPAGGLGVTGALGSAIEFIRFHGGWPEGMYLSSLAVAGDYEGLPDNGVIYKLGFRARYRGIPVLGEEGAVQVSVSSRGVLVYTRLPRQFGKSKEEPRQVLGADDALASLRAFLEKSGEHRLPIVADMYLAYSGARASVDTAQKGFIEPVWALCLADGRTVLVDAYEGDVLSWNGPKQD